MGKGKDKDKKGQRYSEVTELTKENQDFIKRNLNPPTYRFVIYSIITLAGLVIFGLNFGELYSGSLYSKEFSDPTNLSKSFTSLTALITYIFLMIIFLIVYHMGKVNDAVFYSEFENALFAGAAGTGVEFISIVKNDGQIVYFSPNSNKYITYQKKGGTDGFNSTLEILGIDKEGRRKLVDALYSSRIVEVEAAVKNTLGEEGNFILRIEPIERPRSFFVFKLIRISGATVKSDTTGYFAEMLAGLPFGAFAIKSNGEIICANEQLSSLLNYNINDLIKKNLADIVVDYELVDLSNLYNEISFKKSDGEIVEIAIKTSVVNGEGKNYPIICGFVTSEDDGKKNS